MDLEGQINHFGRRGQTEGMTCTEAWTFYNARTLGEIHGQRQREYVTGKREVRLAAGVQRDP